MDIVFLFYDGMTALDAIGPWEVLSRLPGARARLASPNGGRVATDTGLAFDRCAPISDLQRADVLLIPGAGDVRPLLQDARVLDWVRAIDATTRWTTSVCNPRSSGSRAVSPSGPGSRLSSRPGWTMIASRRRWKRFSTGSSRRR